MSEWMGDGWCVMTTRAPAVVKIPNTIGSVELIGWPKQGNQVDKSDQGDQGDHYFY